MLSSTGEVSCSVSETRFLRFSGLPAGRLWLVHPFQRRASLRGLPEAFHQAEGLEAEAAGPSRGCRGLVPGKEMKAVASFDI